MSQTADRYSKALFELAKEQGCLESIQNSMTDIRKSIIDLVDFRLFLKNPLLSYDDRCEIINALFKGKVPELMHQFLLFITFKSRLGILKEIIESFDRLYLLNANQIRAYVTTALPINDNDKALFNEHLKNKFQHDMLTKWKTDPSLIGGFRIFIQGNMYDYSFKNQLNHFIQQSS